MKMYFDKFSKIGSAHKENEDFAVLGDEELPFVIVSDGCSGSVGTSTGSRLLSLSMAEMLRSYWSNSTPYSDFFGFNSAVKADQIRKSLGLKKESLDATLVIACVTENCVYVAMWGDGKIMAGGKNHRRVISVNYTEEIPYYLSYKVCPERNKKFMNIAKSVDLLLEVSDNDVLSRFSPYLNYTVVIDRCGLDYVLISTDGINSFVGKDNNPVNQVMIDEQATSFKRFNGEFIGRRMNRMMKNLTKEGITHYDDFTIAGISFVE